MSFDPADWPADDDDDDDLFERRRLSWREFTAAEHRRRWWLTLWDDVCSLRERYRLPVRARWWEEELQVEALAALAAWTERFDTGDWADPPSKLTLLYELERLEPLLRDGREPFLPGRDRPVFERHLELLGLGLGSVGP